MAKRGKYKGPCPAPTRELTGIERQVQLSGQWYMRLSRGRREAIAATAGSADISGTVLAAWIDAGRPGCDS